MSKIITKSGRIFNYNGVSQNLLDSLNNQKFVHIKVTETHFNTSSVLGDDFEYKEKLNIFLNTDEITRVEL